MKSINFLKDMVLFEGLAKEEITKFIEITQEVFFSQGEIIIKENEAGDTMFIILEGIVEVSKSLALKLGNHVFSENEKILNHLSADNHVVFGEVALFEQFPRTASITAATDVHFYKVKRGDFHKFAHENPAIGYKITRNIARILCYRLRKTNEDVIKLATTLGIALSN